MEAEKQSEAERPLNAAFRQTLPTIEPEQEGADFALLRQGVTVMPLCPYALMLVAARGKR